MSDSSVRDDGGPAFPALVQQLVGHEMAEQPEPKFYGGMSLRDFFAAAAGSGNMTGSTSTEAVAKDAYSIADAMLKERAK